MKTSNLILAATILISLAICLGLMCAGKANVIVPESLKGSGKITTISKDLKDFHMLEVHDNIEVNLMPSSNNSLSITTDENLQSEVLIEEDADGELHLSIKDDVDAKPTDAIKIELNYKRLRKIRVSGEAQVSSDSTLSADNMELNTSGAAHLKLPLEAAHLQARTSGAASMNLSGKASSLDLNASGAGKIRAKEVEGTTAQVRVSGAGEVQVFATGNLRATASGAGNIRYVGEPKMLEHNTSGAASISKLD